MLPKGGQRKNPQTPKCWGKGSPVVGMPDKESAELINGAHVWVTGIEIAQDEIGAVFFIHDVRPLLLDIGDQIVDLKL